MQNPDKFLSLLYMAAVGDKRADVAADVLCNPKGITPAMYYLVVQMPLLEMFGKTPEALVEEIGEYTITPEWKTTGRRVMQLGDIVFVGQKAYLTVAEIDVMKEFKPRFKLLPNVKIKRSDELFRTGIIELEDNQTLKDIVCQSYKKA